MAPGLPEIVGQIINQLEARSAIRDRAIGEGRQITRLAANAVRALHRGELSAADALLADAQDRVKALVDDVQPYANLYWAGYVQDALKEYAEAQITAAIIRQTPIPSPEDLHVEHPAYLNALAEAASELRRVLLDRMRAGDMETAEYLFSMMDSIYDQLVTVDFPDAITGGLRRTTDALRAVLERTRGDLTMTARQQRLEALIRQSLQEPN